MTVAAPPDDRIEELACEIASNVLRPSFGAGRNRWAEHAYADVPASIADALDKYRTMRERLLRGTPTDLSQVQVGLIEQVLADFGAFE